MAAVRSEDHMATMRSLLPFAAFAVLVAGIAAAEAQTTSAVRESVMSSNRLRHQLIIQSQGPQGGVIVFSCRVDDTDAIGVAIQLNKPITGSTTQAVEMVRNDGDRRVVEMMPTEQMLATGAGAARDLYRWFFDGTAVAVRHAGGGLAGFDFSPIKADIDRFKPLCNLGK
jgi:hypothetical protein